MWMTSCTGSGRGGFWGFWKSKSWVLPSEEEGWLSLAHRSQASGLVAGATRVRGWADGKASIKRLCTSLPYVETFNSKVIKGFVPELRSSYLIFVFRDSCVQCYIYVYFTSLCYVHFTHSIYYVYGTTVRKNHRNIF